MNLPRGLGEAGTSVITATRRVARLLRDAHDHAQLERGRARWPSADVAAFEDWCARAWWHGPASRQVELALLDPLQERLVWESVVAEDLSAAADVLLRSPPLARVAQAAWGRLRAWQIDLEQLGRAGSADVRAFQRWALVFRERCANGRWIDRASALDRVIAHPRGALGLQSRRIVVCGIDPLTPQQAALVAALRASGSEVDVPRSRMSAVHVGRVCCDNAEHEIHNAARWARGQLERGACGPIGVVVPKLELRRDRVQAIFDDLLRPGGLLPGSTHTPRPYDLSLGRPLARVAVVRDALLALGLAGGRARLEDVSQALRTAYLFATDERWGRARLDARLRDIGEPACSLDRLAREAGGFALTDLRRRILWLERLDCSRSSPRSVAAWSETFARVLRGLGWPGERSLDSAEYQAVEAFQGLLGGLASLAQVAALQTYREACERLRRFASEQIFQPRSDPAPVQVLGVLESTGLEFSHLWVCGLDDAAWPAAPRPHPFLPIELQRRLRMPHADVDVELEHCRRSVGRWLMSAETVVMSHAERDGDDVRRASSLIAHLPVQSEDSLGLSVVRGHRDRIQRARPRLESFRDERGPTLPSGVPARGGARIFRDQAACPFRAFARHRLGATGAGIADSELDARVRGLLVHRVLELIWGVVAGRAELCARSQSAREELVEGAVTRALDEAAKHRADTLFGALRELEARRLRDLALEWLAAELERDDFSVVAPERTHAAQIGALHVELRPDRIDRLADGTYLLLDYKSGRAGIADWFGMRPEEPQLPLYVCAMEILYEGEREVAAASYGILRRGEVGFLGLGESDAVAPGVQRADATTVRAARKVGDWKAIKRHWQQSLVALAAGFRDGDARVDPKSRERTCRRCGLDTFCRIHERRRTGLAEDETK